MDARAILARIVGFRRGPCAGILQAGAGTVGMSGIDARSSDASSGWSSAMPSALSLATNSSGTVGMSGTVDKSSAR